jgi:hypothetical protein
MITKVVGILGKNVVSNKNETGKILNKTVIFACSVMRLLGRLIYDFQSRKKHHTSRDMGYLHKPVITEYL